jgi:hypothetical protein
MLLTFCVFMGQAWGQEGDIFPTPHDINDEYIIIKEKNGSLEWVEPDTFKLRDILERCREKLGANTIINVDSQDAVLHVTVLGGESMLITTNDEYNKTLKLINDIDELLNRLTSE